MQSSLPLILFVAVGLFSPGPNVIMLTASGARFGFRRTIPHLLGVPIGTGLLAAASALGLNAILLALPLLKLSFQIAAAIWILWLALKTAQAAELAARRTMTGRSRWLKRCCFKWQIRNSGRLPSPHRLDLALDCLLSRNHCGYLWHLP